jgi:hypothetical protein
MTTRFPLPECRGTTAGILETQASYERRAQGWQDRRDLAQQDVLIGQQQVGVSKNCLFQAACKSDSRAPVFERRRLAWDSLVSSI